MASNVVQIEKISMNYLHWEKKLADFYHVERWENIDCSNCLFVYN